MALAFATEKLDELEQLARGLREGDAAIAQALAASDAAAASRRASPRVTNELVRARVNAISNEIAERRSPYAARIAAQRAVLQLPPLPTTTIGSFPQTVEIREARARYKRREIGAIVYLQRIRSEIEDAVRRQEALGLDVLVHGEAERNDMVEFFAEQLWGYLVTRNGWVQSYGSRCVKPAIIYGDVYRPEPMTVETSRSNMELLDAFGAYAYPNDIGPGVYDIHSPRVPAAADMLKLLRRAAEVIAPDRLWVNPDCGLKTRGWKETEAALRAMVEAAHALRAEVHAANTLAASV